MGIVTVDEIDILDATSLPNQRKIIKAQGLYWLFISDGTQICYYYSSDGVAWSAKQLIAGITPSITKGDQFSVWHKQIAGIDYVFLAYSLGTSMQPLYFRRGALNPDGTITWEAEITAFPATIYHFANPVIVVLGDNSICICFCLGTATVHYIYSAQNPLPDGTGSWSYYNIGVGVSTDVHRPPCLITLTGAKCYGSWWAGGPLKGNLWDGSAWVGEETIEPESSYRFHSLNSFGDINYIGYRSAVDYNLYFRQRNTTWSAREGVLTDGKGGIPTITVNPLNGDVTVFWVDLGTVSYKDNILMNRRLAGVWEGWQIAFPNEIDLYILGLTSLLEWVNEACHCVDCKGITAPYPLRYGIWIPVIIVKKYFGDGLVYAEWYA